MTRGRGQKKRTPHYLRLADELEGKVQAGVHRVGEKLPSIRRLRDRTGLSASTVYQAYIELERRGLVEGRQKSGYFVKPSHGRILAPPALRPHRPKPRRVTVNTLAAAVVEAMGDPDYLQLGGTLTAPELLPWRAMVRTLKSMPAHRLAEMLTGYEAPAGNRALRRQISRRHPESGRPVATGDVIVTNGCIEAVRLCLQAVAGPGDAVAVESPTYPWFLQLIEDLGMLALELPTDPLSGIDLPSLERALGENEVRACLLVPNFQNPLGCLMPEENKRALVRMAERHDLAIIEDDIHGDLYFDRRRPPPLHAFDRRGRVMYCSSFSKTLAPGLRIGWCLPGAWRDRVRRLKLNGTIAAPSLPQSLMAAFLEGGAYDRHLRRLRGALRNQTGNVALAIARHFPEKTRISAPRGGLMLWVQLPAGADGMEVYQAARQAGIAILPGRMCSASRRYRNFIRISCGWPWSAEIDDGIRRLGRIVSAKRSVRG